MKRLMLLGLLALALPTAALATSFDFSTGTFVSGTLSGSVATGRTIDVSIVGSLDTISITTGTLTQIPSTLCAAGATCFLFGTGTVSVGPGGSVFTNSLNSGLIIRRGNDVAIAATLEPSATVASGSASADFHFSGTMVTRGSAGVEGTIPEPGTLGLLGTGLVGLAGLVRKFKPGI